MVFMLIVHVNFFVCKCFVWIVWHFASSGRIV